MARGSVYLLYHFFQPDDVVSARLYSDLAEELTAAGFDVTAFPSIRSCHGPRVKLEKRSTWAGGRIRRVWRPAWSQHRTAGRFGNTLFMLLGWAWIAAIMPRRRGEVMVVGTDPVLGVLVAILWRLLRPRSRIVHWCHDLYPDAAVADGMIRDDAAWVRLIRWLTGVAYRRCDVVADLGICMRKRLQSAAGELTVDRGELNVDRSGRMIPAIGGLDGNRVKSSRLVRTLNDGTVARGDDAQVAEPGPGDGQADDSHWWSGRYATLVPWALVEPPKVANSDPLVRRELFGDHRLGLLYSGNFGRAHCFEATLELARRLRGEDVGFCLAGRGMRFQAVQSAVADQDTNIRFAGFAEESELALRLSAADIHLVTLRPNWAGTVVPSKFFGALAAGRPVLFAGDPDSAIARWIDRYQIGWVLTDQTIDALAESLARLSESDAAILAMRQRCFDVYHREFSRAVQVQRWQRVLTGQRYRQSDPIGPSPKFAAPKKSQRDRAAAV